MKNNSNPDESASSDNRFKLPPIQVVQDSNVSINDSEDSFSLTSRSDLGDQQYFPCFDGMKPSEEYPSVYQGLPWSQDTLADLPKKVKHSLDLDQFTEKHAEYLQRLKELNDKVEGLNQHIDDKRPKYEISFFKKK